MKSLTFLIALVFIFSGCQQAPDTKTVKPEPVDKQAVEKEVGELMDRYYAAVKSADYGALGDMLSDEGLYLGTDPEEIWSKEEVLASFEEYKKDPELAQLLDFLTFEVTSRDVHVSKNGKQAVLTDQVKVGFSKLPVRITAILAKRDDWKIGYANTAFLIRNTDLQKVDALFE